MKDNYSSIKFEHYQTIIQRNNLRPEAEEHDCESIVEKEGCLHYWLNNTIESRKEERKMTRIDNLSKGDIFGEIGLLTSLNRTASIKSTEGCLF